MVVLFVIIMANSVEAEVQTIEADGYYIVGDGPDEDHSVAKKRARMDAKRDAAEKAGTFVESLSITKDGVLTNDEIIVASGIVMQIESEVITPEVIGTTTRYWCHIIAKVDSDNVIDMLKQDKIKLSEAVEQFKRQQQELDKIKKELNELKEQYKTANEAKREEINKKIKENEKEFTAVEWVKEGLQYSNLKNYQKAIECYERAIQINPDFDIAWNNLGVAYVMNGGNYPAAIKCCERVIQINPKDDNAWSFLGDVYALSGNTQKAIECSEQAIDINPDNDKAWNNLGYVYNKIDNYQKAIECYEQAIRSNPDAAHNWSDLGYVYFKLENFQKEIECYEQAIKLNPDDDNTWRNLGMAYKFSGNKQKAKECLERAIQINPNEKFTRELLNELS